MEKEKQAMPLMTPDTDRNVSNPHDKGYKRDLANPKEFLHFLQKYVGAEWTKDLTVSQLRLCDKEFISKDYEGKEADLIYEVTRHNNEKIFIFILQELQSTVDYTMVFRILIYIVDILLRYFMATEQKIRERADFRLPAVIPIVFYNGTERWTAVRELKDYQTAGKIFGKNILNLQYYLVDLNVIEEDYILATNTVIDNIMYCDKFRRKTELADVVRTAFQRVNELGKQEAAEFESWVKNILLSICANQRIVVEEILEWARNGDENMAFKYNIIKMVEDERAAGRSEGLTDALISILEELAAIPDDLHSFIKKQNNTDTLKSWIKLAAQSNTIEEFEEKIKTHCP